MGHWRQSLVALLCGALIASSQAPVGFFPAAFLFLPIPFLLAAAAPGWRRAFWIGSAAGTGYFAAGLFWIVEPFLVDAARTGWMAPFALVFMAVGLSLFWAVAFGLARWMAPASGMGRALSFAIALTLAEIARSYVLTGFPWNLLAYGLIDTPLAQLSALIGPHGIGFVIALGAGLIAFHLRSRAMLAYGGALVAAVVWGLVALAAPVPERAEETLVRLVQPNAPQREKWLPDRWPVFLDRAAQATVAPGSPDVVIWPETAVPFLLSDLGDAFAPLSQDTAAPIIFGIRDLTREPDWLDWRNALAVVDTRGEVVARYDKHHLVPFGEYIPFGRVLGGFGLGNYIAELRGAYSPGPGPQLLDVAGIPPFVPLICYEAIFPHLMQPAGPRADWLVHVTNDAWFGEISGPYQHLVQAQFRAIEQGLPVARAANTGVSAMIDPRGRIIADIPLGVYGFVDAVLPGALSRPLYARIGDLPIAILLVLLGLVPLRRRLTE
nr:apolipoprotein N-acyltransferase [Rubricella aquisinus]